jgi:hypothetical protein
VAIFLRPGKTPDGAEVACVLRHVIRQMFSPTMPAMQPFGTAIKTRSSTRVASKARERPSVSVAAVDVVAPR